MTAGALVDTSALLKVVWVSLAGGIGVSIAYSAVVLGLARAGDARRAGRPTAIPYYLLAALGAAVVLYSLYRGYLFVVDKG